MLYHTVLVLLLLIPEKQLLANDYYEENIRFRTDLALGHCRETGSNISCDPAFPQSNEIEVMLTSFSKKELPKGGWSKSIQKNGMYFETIVNITKYPTHYHLTVWIFSHQNRDPSGTGRFNSATIDTKSMSTLNQVQIDGDWQRNGRFVLTPTVVIGASGQDFY